MVRWVIMIVDRLSPLYAALNQYVLQAGNVHPDDRPVRILAPGSGKTRTGHLWVIYLRDNRNVTLPKPNQ
jgi:transposase